MTYFQAIVLGVLQGVTELFPVSSLGHSVILPQLLGWSGVVAAQSATESYFLALLVGLHVATALALVVFYRDTPDAPGPGVAREDDEGQRGRHVEPDEQGQEVRLGRGLRRDHSAPSEELGEDHRMAEARDGEELGDALEQPEHDRLEVGQHGASLPDRVRIGDSPVPLGEPGRPALTAHAVPPRR